MKTIVDIPYLSGGSPRQALDLYHPNSLKLVTLCPGADHAYLPERLPFCLRQNCFRMSLLLLLSLLGCIAAPLCSGADKVNGVAPDVTRTEAQKEQAATGKLTLLRVRIKGVRN